MDIVSYSLNPVSEFAKPGLSGTLGDGMQQVSLRTSGPWMPPKYAYSKSQVEQYGTNLQRGGTIAPFSKGYGPVPIENNYYQSEIKPHVVSTIVTGARRPLVNNVGYVAARPNDEWNSRVANIEFQSRGNPAFYPLPNGIYSTSDTPARIEWAYPRGALSGSPIGPGLFGQNFPYAPRVLQRQPSNMNLDDATKRAAQEAGVQ
jgi:hypothetical protein